MNENLISQIYLILNRAHRNEYDNAEFKNYICQVT